MKFTHSRSLNAGGTKIPFAASGKPLGSWIAMVCLLVFCVARVDGQDADYLGILSLVEQADSLSANGKPGQAEAKYREAKKALAELKRSNPLWNVNMVDFRLKYITGRIAAIAAASASNAVAAAETRTPGALPAASSGVKLLSAGTEPRQILRLRPAKGDKQSLTMTMKLGVATQAGDQAAPAIKIPAVVMSMDAVIKDITTNGDITYDMVVNDARVTSDTEVMPQVAQALEASLALIRGLAGTGALSDRGLNQRMEMSIPSGADGQLSQTLEQIKEFTANAVAPLPEEAVGPGAKWEVKTKLKSQGMTIDQTTQYELLSIEESRINVQLTIAQQAARQKIQNPAMPTLKVDLSKMTSRGKGKSTIDLAKLLPLNGSIDQHTEMAMEMNVGQQKQAMTMIMDINISSESK